MMKKSNIDISYCIPVCNEHDELNKLLTQLIPNIDGSDEICILIDYPNATKEVLDVIDLHSKQLRKSQFKIKKSQLDGDFATFKNEFNSFATKDYIFQIDADELLGTGLLVAVKVLIQNNPADAYNLPRINVITNVDDSWEYNINTWRWRVNDDILGYERVINYPDPQMRLYKNSPGIYWTGKVHERLVGYTSKIDIWESTVEYIDNTMNILEDEARDWSLLHIKDYDRQIKQNKFYETI